MSIISNFINRFLQIQSSAKEKYPILIYVYSFTEAPLIGIFANQLMNKDEFIIFVLPDNNEHLKVRIKSFIKNFNGIFIYLNSELLLNDSITIDEAKFEQIENKYSIYNLDINNLKALYLIQLKEIAAAKKILEQYKPKILIVAEDGVSAYLPLIANALLSNVPVLDIPYGYGSHRDLENALAQKLQKEELFSSDSGAGLAVKELYPQWVKKGKFDGAILLNPYFILAREELGMSVQNPWTVHGGSAIRLAVESRHMLSHYLSEGVQSEKLQLTGTPYCDYIKNCIDENNNEPVAEPFETENKLSILVCWPPSYHAERSELCEFDSYHELTATVFTFLSQLKNAKVTLSLHPAVQSEFREFIAGLNLRISDAYILEELTKHDMYISCFSSTIRWAIALGKPVVNYDFYKFHIDEYKDVPAVLHVDNQIGFEDLVNRLLKDVQYYNEVCLNQKTIASDWGALDGLNFERIYTLINELTESRR